jgi:hypothetical protein
MLHLLPAGGGLRVEIAKTAERPAMERRIVTSPPLLPQSKSGDAVLGLPKWNAVR